jgi:hypothetical protein
MIKKEKVKFDRKIVFEGRNAKLEETKYGDSDLNSYTKDTMLGAFLKKFIFYLDWSLNDVPEEKEVRADIRKSVFGEKNAIYIEDKNSYLNGLPTLYEGYIKCHDGITNKNFGKVTVKIEINYDLDEEMTTK